MVSHLRRLGSTRDAVTTATVSLLWCAASVSRRGLAARGEARGWNPSWQRGGRLPEWLPLGRRPDPAPAAVLFAPYHRPDRLCDGASAES